MAHPPEAAAGRLVSRRRVLLVGWDAADWGVIQPLLDAGHMPHLARLVERGVMGNLLTLQPMLSPMLWTSIATGKRPSKHGVHGFAEVSPDSGDIRPISSRSRTTKAIWNILHQQGKTCHVIGWWPSHPAEPLRGAMVSDLFQKAVGSIEKPWPLPPGTVHPPELAEALTDLRVHPQVGERFREFGRVDGSRGQRPGFLDRAHGLLEKIAHHRAAKRLGRMARPPSDHVAGLALLVQDVPDRLRGARTG